MFGVPVGGRGYPHRVLGVSITSSWCIRIVYLGSNLKGSRVSTIKFQDGSPRRDTTDLRCVSCQFSGFHVAVEHCSSSRFGSLESELLWETLFIILLPLATRKSSGIPEGFPQYVLKLC